MAVDGDREGQVIEESMWRIPRAVPRVWVGLDWGTEGLDWGTKRQRTDHGWQACEHGDKHEYMWGHCWLNSTWRLHQVKADGQVLGEWWSVRSRTSGTCINIGRLCRGYTTPKHGDCTKSKRAGEYLVISQVEDERDMHQHREGYIEATWLQRVRRFLPQNHGWQVCQFGPQNWEVAYR
jgi:hypothetical protein